MAASADDIHIHLQQPWIWSETVTHLLFFWIPPIIRTPHHKCHNPDSWTFLNYCQIHFVLFSKASLCFWVSVHRPYVYLYEFKVGAFFFVFQPFALTETPLPVRCQSETLTVFWQQEETGIVCEWDHAAHQLGVNSGPSKKQTKSFHHISGCVMIIVKLL